MSTTVAWSIESLSSNRAARVREEIKLRLNMEYARLLSKKLKINTVLYYRMYCTVVKLGLSTWKRSKGWGCSRIKYLRRYLGLRKTKLQENWEIYTLLSCMHCRAYSSPNKIRNLKSMRVRWSGHRIARMEKSRNAYRDLVKRPEGKRHLGRPRRR